MARQCDKCVNYNARIDEFRQGYVDIIEKGKKEMEQHFCPMYDSHIPNEIYYNGKECPYFLEKRE